jgi:2-keto-4-pentenoate hydratase/2-oxohepta-3-ene-1,7-dioic acid hydratase in catechol pathway
MSIRLANAGGRAALVCGNVLVDVEERSGGRFGPDPMDAFRDWPAFEDWARGVEAAGGEPALDEAALGPCVPMPRKVFAIALNYRDHAEEAGLEIPKQPLVFTKFPNCLSGPRSEIVLTSNRVDYEAELVVVVGRGGRDIDESKALDHVAGYCVGQDVSDRRQQFAGKPPQFSLGKSYDGYGPIGPAVVGRDAVADPNSLAIRCAVSGETLQDGNTSDMIFPVAELVAFLSRSLTLEPGDLVFTGTPAGVGSVRDPRRYLVDGDVVTTEIEGLGTLVNACRGA